MALSTTLAAGDLARYLARQISNLYPDRDTGGIEIAPHVARALERLEHCFSHIMGKGYWNGTSATFDHLHGDQYAAFLYFVANSIFRDGGDTRIASKIYGLCKAMFALDAFYEVALPEIFCFQHPVGTVLGRGVYSDYLIVYQGCTVGVSIEGGAPRLGKGVCMFAGASILGASTVGDNVFVSPGAIVYGADVPKDSLVFGRSPDLTIKPTTRDVTAEMFRPLEPRRA